MTIATRITQITTDLMFRFYEPGIRRLLTHYETVLIDIGCGGGPDALIENLRGSVPHIWLVVDDKKPRRKDKVLGICTLSDEVPGRHAYIHGSALPELRRHPAVACTALSAMNYAFRVLNVLKVKAEFEADNRGAKGFCWRMGFQREALLKNDNIVGGQLKDVAVYSLPRKRYWRVAASVLRGLWKYVNTEKNKEK